MRLRLRVRGFVRLILGNIRRGRRFMLWLVLVLSVSLSDVLELYYAMSFPALLLFFVFFS